ncbi:MAG: hypothetical protein MJ181_10825 [Treponema sp.]|nr:hypothetical protein [Treponema sp.]
MDDSEIRFNTEIDDSGVDSGLKKINKKLKQFANKMKNSGFAELGSAISGAVLGASASLKILTTSVKAVTKAVKETTEAYRNQARAEIQLDSAVKNSPFLNGQSAKQLKDFASEIQKFTEYGDDYLYPFMAELVNSGRTVDETMDIIKTATDISASGMMDFGSAVSQLNATFQGTTGTLGRQISSIKNLTTEELKSGKAIEILKKQFSGTAEEVAKTVGSSEQLKNAWGDLKEEIGESFEKPLSSVRKALQEIIEKAIEGRKKVKAIANADDGIADGLVKEKELQKLYDDLMTKQGQANDMKERAKETKAILDDETKLNELIAKSRGYTSKKTYEDQYKHQLEMADAYQREANAYAEKYRLQVEADKKTKEKAILDAKTEDDKKARQDALTRATEHYNQIIAKRDATIQNIQNEAKALGTEVDQQDILNAEMTAYLEMASDPLLPTMTQKQLEKVQALVKETNELAIAEGKRTDFQNALSEIDLSADLKKSEILQEQLNTLDELNEAFVNSSTFEQLSANEKMQIWSEYSQKRKKLEEDITNAIEEENEKQKTSLQDVLSTVNDFVSQISNVITSMSDLAQKHAEDEATVKNGEIEKQFKDGLISEEEYYDKKEKLEKESAKKNYQLQMWEWSAGLVQIASSSAQAIANALTMKPATLGIAMASIMGGLASVQLANAIRNKPIPPSFASGGIVGGGAYSSGDNIRANIKTGEMILNQRQQQNLWRMAQGGGRSSGLQNNIEIKNFRGNDTKVTPQFTNDGIKIMIRESIADDLKNRRLNGALLSAENTMNGLHYE